MQGRFHWEQPGIVELKTICIIHINWSSALVNVGCKTYFAVISRERKPVIMQLKLKSVPQNSARETLTVESIKCDPQEEIRDYSLLIKGVHGQSIARLRSAPFICSLKTGTVLTVATPPLYDATPHVTRHAGKARDTQLEGAQITGLLL
ncbi:hypothetical protein DPX16_22233 [Anabarilius grahami]|uniref:Uncharacterized protein n=1 Tax=Anabarilius grahami TaxID=495550 RepID=A0A3N0XP21_ANAGA|nr:hypothetical protein DPX16_22233 [Anabarilius grahami]